ncbi:8539_t:CDS:10 [Entrophospora sp. SA101]|nr:8539_t:CDS:10 [Entrophospora sp. SA101]
MSIQNNSIINLDDQGDEEDEEVNAEDYSHESSLLPSNKKKSFRTVNNDIRKAILGEFVKEYGDVPSNESDDDTEIERTNIKRPRLDNTLDSFFNNVEVAKINLRKSHIAHNRLNNLIEQKSIGGGYLKSYVTTRWITVHEAVASIVWLKSCLRELIEFHSDEISSDVVKKILQRRGFFDDRISNVIEKIGPRKFVAIVSDSGSNVNLARSMKSHIAHNRLNNLIEQKSIGGGYLKSYVTTRWITVHEAVASIVWLKSCLRELIEFHSDEISSDVVKKILQRRGFFDDMEALAQILKPIRTAIQELETTSITLADCYIHLIKIAAAFKGLPLEDYRRIGVNKKYFPKILTHAANIWRDLGHKQESCKELLGFVAKNKSEDDVQLEQLLSISQVVVVINNENIDEHCQEEVTSDSTNNEEDYDPAELASGYLSDFE